MFYIVSAYNSQDIIVWSSDEVKVDRYVNWLNRNREINLYSAKEADASQQAELEARDDVMSMDEPYWDDFMDQEG